MFHYLWSAVGRPVLLLLAAVLLINCGTPPSSSADAAVPPVASPTPAAPITPEAVHAQYLQAATTNDRQALLRLTVPEERIAIGTTMEDFNGFVKGSKLGDPQAGTFLGAEPIHLIDDGQGKIGISMWRWEHTHRCFEIQLAQTDTGWQVAQWYLASSKQVQQFPECAIAKRR